ncbi:Uncharacterized protein SCF082_LOCUS48625 [Durusdinium trenchii]|uniref:Terminase small subunit n=1 Tax=Durusdinium trenchii TaxID=1381693 RepID=A0ABP0RUB7_9DINO
MTSSTNKTPAADRPDLVSISDCADRLNKLGDPITRSGLSRYCKDHDLKRGKVKGIRGEAVDFDEVRKHRLGNFQREVMSGGVQIEEPLIERGDAPIDDVPPAAAEKPAQDPAKQKPGDVVSMDPHRREKNAKAELAELNLAKAKGELALISDIDAGLADAIANVRQLAVAQAKAAAHTAARELGLPPDQIRALQVSFKKFYRDLESRLIDDMAGLTAEAREPRSAARHRLDRLSDMATKIRNEQAAAAEGSA